MKHRIICQALLLLFALTLQAQSSVSDINRIKRDKDYLYGEATLNSKEAALKLAYELLEVEIKNWATQKSADISTVLAKHINDYADTIILPRGNMIRAFAFVKTSNLKAIKGKDMAVKIEKQEKKEKQKAEPVVEEAKPTPVEEPVEEKAEPVAEETKPAPVEEPVEENTEPAVEETKPAPVEEPVEEKTEPVVEEAKPTPVEPVKTEEEKVLERVLAITSFYDLEKTIKPLKEAGKIAGYGKYTTMSDPANSYLIVYDQQANIKAVLGKGTSSRKNLKTGLDDSEKNYHGCGAIWFKVK